MNLCIVYYMSIIKRHPMHINIRLVSWISECNEHYKTYIDRLNNKSVWKLPIILQQNDNYNVLVKIIIIMTIIILKKLAAMINLNLNQRCICAMGSSSVRHTYMYMYLSCTDTAIGYVNEYHTMHCFGIPRHTQSMIAYINLIPSHLKSCLTGTAHAQC